MDPLSQTLLLCTAVLAVAAAAVTAFALTQRTYQGFRWWSMALWLNTGAALLATLDPGNVGWVLAQWLFVCWPILGLLGLRRFHARLSLPGSARGDLALLAGLLAASGLGPWLPSGSATVQLLPLAAGLALLYAAAVAWRAGAEPDAMATRALAGLWLLTAAPALLSALGWWQAAGSAVVQTGVVAVASLVTAFVVLTSSSRRTERELRDSRRRLRILANIDMLTQVPNRRRFEELARRALQTDAPDSATLLLLDIDHFKQINDKLGHAAGDRALRLVSRCTMDLLRSQDVAGRHGGDEFVLLLRRSSTQDAMQVAERLVRHLQAQAHANALPRLSLSFGIVQMRRGESIDDTLQRADLALYEAKRLGRSRAVAADVEEDDERPVFRSSQRLGLTSS
jgi:diguanylate cyclase (GGDEF)-like protein